MKTSNTDHANNQKISSDINAATAIILSTGTEITEGLYPDTNAQEISQRLKLMGIRTLLHHAIPDDSDIFCEILHSTFGKADLVICTGGIGPTEDDLNRELIADIYDQKLVRIPEAEVMIKDRFTKRGRELPIGNLKQADVPESSTPLLNHWGTACGFFLKGNDDQPAIISLPGVPHEWRSMFDAYFPELRDQLFQYLPIYKTETIHVVLVPESHLNLVLKPFFTKWPDITVGILAKLGRVRIRLTATGSNLSEVDSKISKAVKEIVPHLPEESIFSIGEEDISLEQKIVTLFSGKKLQFGLAESCTGGGIAKRITDISGSSEVFDRGFVTYSNEAKMEMIGVEKTVLDKYGAVSAECVESMAKGVLNNSNADVAVSVSGIAGPNGGTEDKPVGTVWFGIADQKGTCESILKTFGGTRSDIRAWSENQALELLRRWALEIPFEK